LNQRIHMLAIKTHHSFNIHYSQWLTALVVKHVSNTIKNVLTLILETSKNKWLTKHVAQNCIVTTFSQRQNGLCRWVLTNQRRIQDIIPCSFEY
jgi:hypothetical protein